VIEDKKTPEPLLPETVRPRSEMKLETAVSRSVDAGSKTQEDKAGDKPVADSKPGQGTETDPFSIDAIEMEFARLLGRDTKPKT
jgi:flagellar protein FliO/FliZ